MKRIAAIIAATLFAGLFAFPAWAGPGKAGLWEVTTQMNFAKGGPPIPRAQHEKTKPTEVDRSSWRTTSRAQRTQLEQTKQMGIASPFGQPVVNKVCITPKMAASDEPPETSKVRSKGR